MKHDEKTQKNKKILNQLFSVLVTVRKCLITVKLLDGKPMDKVASACWLVAIVIFSAFLTAKLDTHQGISSFETNNHIMEISAHKFNKKNK